ncbi:MAG: zinc ribbon domain-containing protein [Bacillota bacterium]
MDRYIKCPRCEVNYILESAKFCDVCKAELKIAPDIYSEEEEDMVLCPVCGKHFIFPDEVKCSYCKGEVQEELDHIEIEEEKDEEWRSFLDPEPEADEELPDGMQMLAFDDVIEEEEAEADDEESFEDTYAYDYDDNFEEEDDDDDYDEEEDDEDY